MHLCPLDKASLCKHYLYHAASVLKIQHQPFALIMAISKFHASLSVVTNRNREKSKQDINPVIFLPYRRFTVLQITDLTPVLSRKSVSSQTDINHSSPLIAYSHWPVHWQLCVMMMKQFCHSTTCLIQNHSCNLLSLYHRLSKRLATVALQLFQLLMNFSKIKTSLIFSTVTHIQFLGY